MIMVSFYDTVLYNKVDLLYWAGIYLEGGEPWDFPPLTCCFPPLKFGIIMLIGIINLVPTN